MSKEYQIECPHCGEPFRLDDERDFACDHFKCDGCKKVFTLEACLTTSAYELQRVSQ